MAGLGFGPVESVFPQHDDTVPGCENVLGVKPSWRHQPKRALQQRANRLLTLETSAARVFENDVVGHLLYYSLNVMLVEQFVEAPFISHLVAGYWPWRHCKATPAMAVNSESSR
jgi:hypothetical protein